jgi:hypothetical protein
MQNANLFWAGLSALASKRFDRDLLVTGQHELAYRISGADKRVEKICGVLTVSPNQARTSTTKPRLDDLLAAIFYRLSAKKRAEIVDLIALKGLESDDASNRLASELIMSLSVQSTSLVRGSLAFEPK